MQTTQATPTTQTTSLLQEHVDTIAKHEQEFLAGRSAGERVADRVATFAGTFAFVTLHLLVFTLWMVWNALPATQGLHFDPMPYALLDTIVALEAILLASFILMRQSSHARRADQREHLMLQILLLTEKEVSAVVRMTQEMAKQAGIRSISKDAEIEELGRPTSIDEVAQTIEEGMKQE